MDATRLATKASEAACFGTKDAVVLASLCPLHAMTVAISRPNVLALRFVGLLFEIWMAVTRRMPELMCDQRAKPIVAHLIVPQTAINIKFWTACLSGSRPRLGVVTEFYTDVESLGDVVVFFLSQMIALRSGNH